MLVPPIFDPLPEFPEAQAMGKALRAALAQANPARVVYLSTIGAQANQSNLLTQHTIIEKAIGEWLNPVTFLRPAWFMENSVWDLAPAREQGVIPKFPATAGPAGADGQHRRCGLAGRVAARIAGNFGERKAIAWWNSKGRSVVEAAFQNKIATTSPNSSGCPVRMEAVHAVSWEAAS